MLYILSDQSWWLIGVQLLDGVGAGITPLGIADLMRGTGRFNVAQGAVATMQGIAASALAALWRLMPETAPDLRPPGATQASTRNVLSPTPRALRGTGCR